MTDEVVEDRRDGRVRRVTVRRAATGRCMTCGQEWTGSAAMGAASVHAQMPGHYTEATYSASYVYVAAVVNE